MSMTVRLHCLQSAGTVPDGLIAALADTAFFHAVRSLLQRGTTAKMKLNSLVPVRDGALTATLMKAGGLLIAAEAQVTHRGPNLIARGLGTYFVKQP